MKRYELKEADRQKALEKALPGFTLELQRACKNEFADPFDHVNITNEEGGWSLHLHKILIKEVISYDPNAWNNYPEVTPPEDVLMRVECKNGKRACAKFHTFSDGGCWCDPNGAAWPLAYSEGVKRFRPWE